MQQLAEEEADPPFEEDVLFMNEEEREMMDSCAAAIVAMEVDEGSPGGILAGDTRIPEIVRQLPEQEEQGAPSGTLAGATTQEEASGLIAEVQAAPTELDASHIREAAAQTLAFIKRQEAVLDECTTALSLKDEGTEEYKALQGQIEVLERMRDYYRLVLQQAHSYAPAPHYSFET
eukprot:5889513-Amphidinium_carterae.1